MQMSVWLVMDKNMPTKKVTTKKETTTPAVNNDRRYAKAMIMANLVGRGNATMNQIEETAEYIVGKCYGSTEG